MCNLYYLPHAVFIHTDQLRELEQNKKVISYRILCGILHIHPLSLSLFPPSLLYTVHCVSGARGGDAGEVPGGVESPTPLTAAEH